MQAREIVLEELIQLYEKRVPLDLSMSFDHNGLKLGRADKRVKKILTSLELTREVVDDAIENDIDVIFVHHDPLFNAPHYLLSSDPHMRLSLDLLKNDIALYVSHTNLDIVSGGLNDYIFKQLGGIDAQVLDVATGVGRIGKLALPLTLEKYIEQMIQPASPTFKVTRNSEHNQLVRTIAVVNGSGADFIEQAYMQKADVFISGDIDYHHAMFGVTYAFPIIDMGHDYEYVVSKLFKELLVDIGMNANVELEIDEFTKSFYPWETLK